MCRLKTFKMCILRQSVEKTDAIGPQAEVNGIVWFHTGIEEQLAFRVNPPSESSFVCDM